MSVAEYAYAIRMEVGRAISVILATSKTIDPNPIFGIH
jgi:hypothetical protein